MVLAAFLAVFFVAPVASGLVYADATRRGLSQQERLLSAFLVVLVSFCGFLLPHLLEESLNYVYLHGVKSAPVVTSPYEILALHLTVGIAISTVSVLLYGLGTRYRTSPR